MLLIHENDGIWWIFLSLFSDCQTMIRWQIVFFNWCFLKNWTLRCCSFRFHFDYGRNWWIRIIRKQLRQKKLVWVLELPGLSFRQRILYRIFFWLLFAWKSVYKDFLGRWAQIWSQDVLLWLLKQNVEDFWFSWIHLKFC